MYEETSRTPDVDFVALLQQRLAQKTVATGQASGTKGTFDPHQLMVSRKNQNAEQLPPIQSYSQEDIEKLQTFCAQHGILGFNCGRMSPLAALSFLKQKMGIVDTPQPSEGYGPNYPFTQPVQKKQLLKG
jgi:hypothetical protein